MKSSVTCATALLAAAAAALPQQLPTSGDDGNLGGIFGISIPVPGIPWPIKSVTSVISSLIPSFVPTPDPNGIAAYLDIDHLLGHAFTKGPEYPRSKISLKDFYDPGTGPYPAHFFTVPDLPNHVVYAPKQRPPENVKMPTMVWGNGLCLSSGTAYGPFLMEVASHGYIVIATGPIGAPPPSLMTPTGVLSGPNGEQYDRRNGLVLNGFSSVKDMLDSIDWVVKGNADKYGNIDKDTFITAGTSCGGLEAYSAAYKNDRVKLIASFNSGTMSPSKRPLVKELKAKIAYITGGPKDIAWENGLDDYASLPVGLPTLRADLDSGHLGTFFAKNGGKYGEAASSLFDWMFRNDTASKAKWVDSKSQGSLVSKGWNITRRNFD